MNIPEPFASLGDNRINIDFLVEQLQTGGVIPFVGAGMSVPFGFPDWKTFLLSMAPDNAAKERIEKCIAKGDYEEAAEILLEFRGSNGLQDALDFTFRPSALR